MLRYFLRCFLEQAGEHNQIAGDFQTIDTHMTPLYSKCTQYHFTVFHSCVRERKYSIHYSDVIMGAMASQITSLTIVYSTAYSGADQRKHQSSASLAFVRGIHRWPVNSPHKGSVTQKMFPFDDVVMWTTETTKRLTDHELWIWYFL